MNYRPRVSIGLPVHNGARHLPATLDSLRAQTFGEFELIISDNASSDDTESICRAYAKRDARIRYFRTKENLGAAANFNRVFDFARGEYFKWATHRDVYASAYLERCVAMLGGDLSVVLAQSAAVVIDDAGQRIPTFESRETPFDHVPNVRPRSYLYDPSGRKLDASNGPVRFHDLLIRTHRCFELFGLIRRDALERTSLHLPCVGSGKILLSHLALIGRIATVAEELFFPRFKSSAAKRRNDSFPTPKAIAGHLRTIVREPMPLHERLECALIVVRWALRLQKWKKLLVHKSGPLHQTLPA